MTYPLLGDSGGSFGYLPKGPVIPDDLLGLRTGEQRWGPSGLPAEERSTSHQLVGEVKAHQGDDG